MKSTSCHSSCLTTQPATCMVPSFRSSFKRGASSPLRTAVRSLSEKRWRSSVRWPGTPSNWSRTLRGRRRSKRLMFSSPGAFSIPNRLWLMWTERLTLWQSDKSWRDFSCEKVAFLKPEEEKKRLFTYSTGKKNTLIELNSFKKLLV